MIPLLVSAALAQELEPVYFGGDIVPGVGTSSTSRGRDERNLSLNLIGGYAGAIEGAEASLVFNLVRLDVEGGQGAGGFNLVGGSVEGGQGAGWFNVVGGSVEGAQGAGGVNLVGSGVEGVQGAGGGNVVSGDFEGVQGSGGFNLVNGSFEGVQATGGFNIVSGDFEGVQGSGGFNLARGRVEGIQGTGGFNLAGGVEGLQIGAVNLSTEPVDGIQIGVVNLAPDADFALGVINVFWNGRTHLDGWVTEDGYANVGFKHGGSRFHYLYTAGYLPAPEVVSAWRYGLGLGGHHPLGSRVFVDTDALVQHIVSPPRWEQLQLLSTARLVGGINLGSRLAITGGPSYNVLVSEGCATRYDGPGTTIFAEDRSAEVRGWPGWSLGLQLF